MILNSRGLGYRQDKPDERDLRFAASGPELGPYILAEANQEAYVLRVRDQLGTSSCVGNAFVGAVETCCAIAGRPCHLSARWPYVVGVEAERPSYRGPLLDDGSFPRLVMNACRERGLLPERSFPFSEDEIVKRPAPADAVSAFDARGLRYYRIDEVGEARIAAIEDALRRGYGVIFGTQVGVDYQRNRGELVTSMGRLLGGHMQQVTTIDRKAKRARGPNSWGREWGDRGFFNIELEFFANMPMSDIYVVMWAPEIDDAG